MISDDCQGRLCKQEKQFYDLKLKEDEFKKYYKKNIWEIFFF